MVRWNELADLEDGTIVHVVGNLRGGMEKRSKKKKETNPWELDEGSGVKSSSAEEQFEELGKEKVMEGIRMRSRRC